MENGRFTEGERGHLPSLDAVGEARAKSIVCSKRFKGERMRRHHAGEKPGAIFADAGLPSSPIGYKRIERAIRHWKGAEAKGALTAADAPQARHRDRADTIKREKREAVERRREARRREAAAMEERLAGRKAREEKVMASQAAGAAALEAQAKALRALGALARRARRGPRTAEKPGRFGPISRLKADDPRLNVGAAARRWGRRGAATATGSPPRPSAPSAGRPTRPPRSRRRPRASTAGSRGAAAGSWAACAGRGRSR